MDISVMRKIVADLYDGMAWKSKVSRMPDNQVFAIYKSYESKGQLNKKKEESKNESYKQMTIFDYVEDI